jgi:hypothetical protein
VGRCRCCSFCRGMASAIGMKGRGQGIARIAGLKAITFSDNRRLPVAISPPIRVAGLTAVHVADGIDQGRKAGRGFRFVLR